MEHGKNGAIILIDFKKWRCNIKDSEFLQKRDFLFQAHIINYVFVHICVFQASDL